MAFVKFTETGRSFYPKASINPKGSLSFSDGARQRFDMDKYAFGVFYYDAENKQIGIELGNDEATEGAVKLRLRQTGGATMGAKSFVDYFDLNIQKTTMFDVKAGQSANWVVIDLKTARERNTKDDEVMGEEDSNP
jgi:hypothetical protein